MYILISIYSDVQVLLISKWLHVFSSKLLIVTNLKIDTSYLHVPVILTWPPSLAINNTVIKLLIYFNSHVYVYWWRNYKHHSSIHVFIKDWYIQILELFFWHIFFSRKKYLRQPSIDFAGLYNATKTLRVTFVKCE